MKIKILFIINPRSGVSEKHDIPELIYQYLDNSKFDAQIEFTKYSGHGFRLASEAVAKQFDVVCAVGGDGSVHNVGVALVNTQVKLAIIPAGSGNGYARHYAIPTRVREALLTINQMKVRTVDVGKINRKYFLGVTGFGFDAHIAAKFAKRKRRGFSPYVFLVLREYFRFSEKQYHIEFESGKKIASKAWMVTVSNATEFGSGFCVSPFSDTQDGELEMTILRKPPIWASLGLIRRFFKGTAPFSPYIKTYRFKKASVSCDYNNVHADGEPIKLRMPIEVEVFPKGLKLIVGENFT
jgi:YegS/Rv2252/BmrU family lipid kinase